MAAPPEGPQERLKREGVVLVPTALVDDRRRAETQQAFYQHIRDSPEFLNPDPENLHWKPSLGGFAGMGNPSSFHHPFVRTLREQMLATVLDADVLPLEGRSLEKVYDRLIFRNPGDTPGYESMHRDEAETALDGDVVLGGWVNLDDHVQYFSCAPRTHTEVGNQNKGFARITSPEEQAHYRARFQRIAIFPGYMIVFYERIVHEVLATTATRRMLRMHLGWRITDALEPLFGTAQTRDWICNQSTPHIKSGQHAPILAKMHLSNWYNRIGPWAERTFRPECLTTHTVRGGKGAGTTYTLPKLNSLHHRAMLGLGALGLPLHPRYDAAEQALLFPARSWRLRTFDSPEERVAYAAPSAADWEAYQAALAALADVGHQRPARPAPRRA
tara:strand:- start:201 stop:1361 length:1161 start_codon:yes stop_codon:yes gene_type:complete